jgi:hypothetical protein
MLNEQLNSEQINSKDNHVSGNIKLWTIQFDWLDLMSACPSWINWIWVQKANFFDLDNIDLWEYESSVYDGWWIYSKKYGNKKITLTLFIQWINYDDLINTIDELKVKTQEIEKDLIIKVKWMNWVEQFRQYKATLSSLKIPSFWRNDTFVDDIQADFIITSWVWEEVNKKINFFPWEGGNFEHLVLNLWYYEAFPEVILICKPEGNAISSVNVELKKIWETSWVTVQIQETILDGSIIKFDYKNKIVTLNWVEIPFFGFMTAMQSGKYSVFNVSFWAQDAVNLDCYINYNPTYL